MDNAVNVLNGLFVEIFNNILRIEHAALNSGEFSDLSITEIHTIEAIGVRQLGTMTEVASHLKITVGTLTVNVNNLVRKGYVERRRIEQDRRVVQLQLTEKGMRIFENHEKFHKDMAREIIDALEEGEETIIIKSLESVRRFLKSKYK